MYIIFAGIAIALLVTELTGYSPGGIVAAGYLALFAGQPVWLAGTLAAALATFAVVRGLETRLLLYGRRQFAIYLLTGMLVGQAAMLLTRGNSRWESGILVIGYLVPGLIARDFTRQGIIATLVATGLTVALIRLLALAGEGL